eukprot:SAG22_NODE_1038_length_5890_cov_5.432050_4_plen_237_part_00
MHAQCFKTYTEISDAWRRDSQPLFDQSHNLPCHHLVQSQPGPCSSHRDGGQSCASYLGTSSGIMDIPSTANSGMWFRFTGDAGTAISNDPSKYCQASRHGWLSAYEVRAPEGQLPEWATPESQDGAPPDGYQTPGQAPTSTADGIVQMTLCFNNPEARYEGKCSDGSAVVNVVNCGLFYLWQLPPGQGFACGWAICTADACVYCAQSGQCTDAEWRSSTGCTCTDGWAGHLCTERT